MIETQKASSHKQANRDSDSLNSSAHKFLSHHAKIALFLVTSTLMVIAIALMLFIQNQSLKAKMGLPTFKLPWTQTTCTYNGQIYQAGESVPSSDGCNSCSCDESGQVACTEMACTDIIDQSNTDATEAWNTYTNYQYAFKFPLGLIAKTSQTEFAEYFSKIDLLNEKNNELVYQITISNKPNTYTGTLLEQHANKASPLRLNTFNDNKHRVWNIEEPVWVSSDMVEIYSDTLTNGDYHQVRIITYSRALGELLGQEMILVDEDTYDASPTIDHLTDLNTSILSTLEFANNTPKDNEIITFNGKLEPIERPAPDIEYDYQLKLDTPYFDELNAQGPTNITSIVVVPENDSMRQTLASNVGRAVSIEGVIEWGLAETRHLKAKKIVLKLDN